MRGHVSPNQIQQIGARQESVFCDQAYLKDAATDYMAPASLKITVAAQPTILTWFPKRQPNY